MRILLVILLTVPMASYANTVYVKSFKAKILSNAKHGSKVVKMFARGQKLNLEETKGIWAKVSFSSGEGWMPKILTSIKKPMNRKSLLSSKHNLSSKARKRASSFTSAAAARGLLAGAEKQMSNMKSTDYKALKRVERWSVSQDIGRSYLVGDQL